jgi:hypothetical protein
LQICIINQRIAFASTAFPAIFALEKNLGGNLREEGLRNFAGKPQQE